ncbi:helix-turn-helix domain-containing protein [Propionivibrio sp.]|uniref:helix-turn-helix domain-containing protein n=1 Tax=Propionivibrio sp. TaxID=2212460 RepID=UPI003BF32E7E
MPLLFWSLNFLLLSGATNPTLIYHEAGALCREFGLGEFKRKDELGTLYAKAKDFEADKTVTYRGREYPALYTPRNSTLIDIFQIEAGDQAQLRTIIGADELATRHRAQETVRRRAAGAVSRDTHLTANEDKRASARLMAAQGMSQMGIAAELGVSVGSVNSWIR